MTKTYKKIISLFIALLLIVGMTVAMFLVADNDSSPKLKVVNSATVGRGTSTANAGQNGYVANNYTPISGSKSISNTTELGQFLRNETPFNVANGHLTADMAWSDGGKFSQSLLNGKTLDGCGFKITLDARQEDTGWACFSRFMKPRNLPGAHNTFLKRQSGGDPLSARAVGGLAGAATDCNIKNINFEFTGYFFMGDVADGSATIKNKLMRRMADGDIVSMYDTPRSTIFAGAVFGYVNNTAIDNCSLRLGDSAGNNGQIGIVAMHERMDARGDVGTTIDGGTTVKDDDSASKAMMSNSICIGGYAGGAFGGSKIKNCSLDTTTMTNDEYYIGTGNLDKDVLLDNTDGKRNNGIGQCKLMAAATGEQGYCGNTEGDGGATLKGSRTNVFTRSYVGGFVGIMQSDASTADDGLTGEEATLTTIKNVTITGNGKFYAWSTGPGYSAGADKMGFAGGIVGVNTNEPYIIGSLSTLIYGQDNCASSIQLDAGLVTGVVSDWTGVASYNFGQFPATATYRAEENVYSGVYPGFKLPLQRENYIVKGGLCGADGQGIVQVETATERTPWYNQTTYNESGKSRLQGVALLFEPSSPAMTNENVSMYSGNNSYEVRDAGKRISTVWKYCRYFSTDVATIQSKGTEGAAIGHWWRGVAMGFALVGWTANKDYTSQESGVEGQIINKVPYIRLNVKMKGGAEYKGAMTENNAFIRFDTSRAGNPCAEIVCKPSGKYNTIWDMKIGVVKKGSATTDVNNRGEALTTLSLNKTTEPTKNFTDATSLAKYGMYSQKIPAGANAGLGDFVVSAEFEVGTAVVYAFANETGTGNATLDSDGNVRYADKTYNGTPCVPGIMVYKDKAKTQLLTEYGKSGYVNDVNFWKIQDGVNPRWANVSDTVNAYVDNDKTKNYAEYSMSVYRQDLPKIGGKVVFDIYDTAAKVVSYSEDSGNHPGGVDQPARKIVQKVAPQPVSVNWVSNPHSTAYDGLARNYAATVSQIGGSVISNCDAVVAYQDKINTAIGNDVEGNWKDIAEAKFSNIGGYRAYVKKLTNRNYTKTGGNATATVFTIDKATLSVDTSRVTGNSADAVAWRQYNGAVKKPRVFCTDGATYIANTGENGNCTSGAIPTTVLNKAGDIVVTGFVTSDMDAVSKNAVFNNAVYSADNYIDIKKDGYNVTLEILGIFVSCYAMDIDGGTNEASLKEIINFKLTKADVWIKHANSTNNNATRPVDKAVVAVNNIKYSGIHSTYAPEADVEYAGVVGNPPTSVDTTCKKFVGKGEAGEDTEGYVPFVNQPLANVGQYKVVCAVIGDNNYNDITVTFTFDITPRTIKMTSGAKFKRLVNDRGSIVSVVPNKYFEYEVGSDRLVADDLQDRLVNGVNQKFVDFVDNSDIKDTGAVTEDQAIKDKRNVSIVVNDKHPAYVNYIFKDIDPVAPGTQIALSELMIVNQIALASVNLSDAKRVYAPGKNWKNDKDLIFYVLNTQLPNAGENLPGDINKDWSVIPWENIGANIASVTYRKIGDTTSVGIELNWSAAVFENAGTYDILINSNDYFIPAESGVKESRTFRVTVDKATRAIHNDKIDVAAYYNKIVVSGEVTDLVIDCRVSGSSVGKFDEKTTFDGLKAETNYTLMAKIKGTDNYIESATILLGSNQGIFATGYNVDLLNAAIDAVSKNFDFADIAKVKKIEEMDKLVATIDRPSVNVRLAEVVAARDAFLIEVNTIVNEAKTAGGKVAGKTASVVATVSAVVGASSLLAAAYFVAKRKIGF